MFGIQIWLFFFCRCVAFVVVVSVYAIWRWIESDLSWHCLNTIIGNQTVGNHLKRSIIRTIWLHSGNSANNIDDSSILSSLPKIKWLMKILLKNMQTARISPRRQFVGNTWQRNPCIRVYVSWQSIGLTKDFFLLRPWEKNLKMNWMRLHCEFDCSSFAMW